MVPTQPSLNYPDEQFTYKDQEWNLSDLVLKTLTLNRKIVYGLH